MSVPHGRDPPDHAGFQESATDFALGILTGDERATALAHLQDCRSCQVDVDELASIADLLLLAAPVVDPPIGFELRLAERLGADNLTARLHGPRRRRVLALVSIVTVAAGLGFLMSRAIDRAGRVQDRTPEITGADSPRLTVTNLDNGGKNRGTVVVAAGTPSWLYMTVQDQGRTGPARCQINLGDGRTITLGSLWLSSGHAAWGSPLPIPTRELRGARLVATDGSTIATARFPPFVGG